MKNMFTNEFAVTFLLPFAVGLTSIILPAWLLEKAADQPWAKKYHITYKGSQDRWTKDRHHHDFHEKITAQSLLCMVVATLFGASVLYITQPEGLSYASLTAPVPVFTWIFQFVAYIYTMDFVQYTFHYLGHKNKFLWKHVHSKHHQIHTPSAMQCAYGQIMSSTMGAALPLVVAYFLVYPCATVFYVAAANQIISFGPYGHSGLQLPWLDLILGYGWLPFRATPYLHDAHHRLSGKDATNLGTTVWLWDWLFGTLTSDRV
jgi:sterol desaturase/sphingolipid hydroxylase (fatty acid hydroxylase superfamily)